MKNESHARYDTVQTLRLSRLGRGLSSSELAQFARCAKPIERSAGDLIIAAGTPANHVYVIAQGSAVATLPRRHEKKTIRLTRHVGDHIGDIAIFREELYAADISAAEDCRLLQITREAFLELLEQIPGVTHNLIRSLGGLIKETLLDKPKRRRSRIIAFVCAEHPGRELLHAVLEGFARRGELVTVLENNDSQAPNPPWHQENLTRPNASGTTELNGRISELLTSRSRVFLMLHPDQNQEDLPRCLSSCDRIFWLTSSHQEAKDRQTLEQVRRDVPGIDKRIVGVWLLRPEERYAPPRHPVWESLDRMLNIEVAEDREHPTRLEKQGVDRLVRDVQGIRLGLALGGGSARGMAHLGVLRVLDEAGINFDLIAGTSCGAMVAAAYAAGYSAKRAIEHFTHDLTPTPLHRFVPNKHIWFMFTKFRTGGWDRMLRAYLQNATLERLQVPTCCVTVDLIEAKKVVRRSGDAVHAILESINLPGFSQPIFRDGMALVDGGVLDVMPTDVLAKDEMDLIVGVDVSKKIEMEFAGNRADTPRQRLKKPGTLRTILRITETQDRALKSGGARLADLIIEPDTAAFDVADFSRTPDIAAAGESATREQLACLQTMLEQIESQAMILPK